MKKEITIVVVVLVLVLGAAFLLQKPAGPGKYDTFAQCIKSSGTTFYGAFWCPHCRDQKALFGTSVKYLPYVECSLPDGQTQTPICIEKKITGYPTWVFPNGDRLSGLVALKDLSQKTSCPLPEGDDSVTASTTTVGSQETKVVPNGATSVQGSVNVGTENGLPDGKL